MASPEAIANRLRQLEDALQAGTKALHEAVAEYKRLGVEAAKAEVAAKTVFAAAFLGAEGPETTRKQIAQFAAETEQQAEKVAAHLVLTQREALFALKEDLKRIHAQIDVARTLAANSRAELELDKTNWRP